ncbi:hypothetical protein FB45DRAFT_918979 [Roridomyces roridus]|uniref:Uncharacterized protein n=1 Tax=Roridomyces roridus TaxID=1738132 RepID=A0AAD7BRQ1_9AGAR|nr:hypothetical protein FB45DRAFT_918979 [Roridomyces roridus]
MRNRLVGIGRSCMVCALGNAIRDVPSLREGCEDGLNKNLEHALLSDEVLDSIMNRICRTLNLDFGAAVQDCTPGSIFLAWVGALADDVAGSMELAAFLTSLVWRLVENGVEARRAIIPPREIKLRSDAQSSYEEAGLMLLNREFRYRRINALLDVAFPPVLYDACLYRRVLMSF